MLKDYIPGAENGNYLPDLFMGEDVLDWAKDFDKFSRVEVIKERMKDENFPELLVESHTDVAKIGLFAAFLTEVVGVMTGELGLDRKEFVEKIEKPSVESFRIKVEERDALGGMSMDAMIEELLRAFGVGGDGRSL